jgi:hypothetical protein
MLRRRRRAPEPGPIERASRRRRRIVAAGAFVVVLFAMVFVALLMGAWLREYPAIDARWVQVPGAVALVQLDWSGDGKALVRPTLQSFHRRKLSDTIQFDAFWSSLQFMLHPRFTLWLFPADGASSGTRLRWLAVASLKRRQGVIDRRINDMLAKAGAGGVSEGEGATKAGGGRLAGGVRGGGFAMTVAPDRLDKTLGILELAAKASAGPHAALIDDIWDSMPGDKPPWAFAIRRPARWAEPSLRFIAGDGWSELLDALRPASAALFADAPLLAGKGTLSDSETLVVTLVWNEASGGEARRLQEATINQLIENINKTFQEDKGFEVRASSVPVSSGGKTELEAADSSGSVSGDQVGIVVAIAHWERMISKGGETR